VRLTTYNSQVAGPGGRSLASWACSARARHRAKSPALLRPRASRPTKAPPSSRVGWSPSIGRCFAACQQRRRDVVVWRQLLIKIKRAARPDPRAIASCAFGQMPWRDALTLTSNRDVDFVVGWTQRLIFQQHCPAVGKEKRSFARRRFSPDQAFGCCGRGPWRFAPVQHNE
jgi:hypothetical protein